MDFPVKSPIIYYCCPIFSLATYLDTKYSVGGHHGGEAQISAALYFLIGRNPTFACIGAVYGMGSDMGDSWKQGGNRLIGTVIGGFLGMALFWLYLILDPSGETRALLVPLLALGVVVLIVLAQIFQWPTAVQPGSVVLCIILFNTPVDTYVSYALNRMVDTGVGVIFSMLINYLLPRERLEPWLEKLRGSSGRVQSGES